MKNIFKIIFFSYALNGFFLVHAVYSSIDSSRILKQEIKQMGQECPICFEAKDSHSGMALSCKIPKASIKHWYCFQCLKRLPLPVCPVCNQVIAAADVAVIRTSVCSIVTQQRVGIPLVLAWFVIFGYIVKELYNSWHEASVREENNYL